MKKLRLKGLHDYTKKKKKRGVLTSRIHEHCEKGNRSIAISKRKELPEKEYREK